MLLGNLNIKQLNLKELIGPVKLVASSLINNYRPGYKLWLLTVTIKKKFTKLKGK